MDIKQETIARESHKRILGKRLLDGEPLVEVMEDHPELIFGYKRIKADVGAYFKDRARHQKEKAVGIPTEWGFWCRLLTGKRRHFWFWSSGPDRGKTTMLKNLDAKYACSWWNY